MPSRFPPAHTTAQIVTLTGLSMNLVNSLISAGEIPGAFQLNGRGSLWLFEKAAFDRWWEDEGRTHRALSRGRPSHRDALRWARELYERGYEQHIILRSLGKQRGINQQDAFTAIMETTEYMSIGILYNEHRYYVRLRKRARGPFSNLDAAKKAFAEMSATAELMMDHAPKVRSTNAMSVHREETA